MGKENGMDARFNGAILFFCDSEELYLIAQLFCVAEVAGYSPRKGLQSLIPLDHHGMPDMSKRWS